MLTAGVELLDWEDKSVQQTDEGVSSESEAHTQHSRDVDNVEVDSADVVSTENVCSMLMYFFFVLVLCISLCVLNHHRFVVVKVLSVFVHAHY